LHEHDINYANEKNYKIKLVPTIKQVAPDKVAIFVLPKFIQQHIPLFFTDNEFNGVIVEGEFSGEQFLKGRGAGGHPTGAAVLSDISALSYGYKYGYKKITQNKSNQPENQISIKLYLRYNTEDELKKLKPISIDEKFESAQYKFVVGYFNLKTIKEEKDLILSNKLFVCVANDEVELL